MFLIKKKSFTKERSHYNPMRKEILDIQSYNVQLQYEILEYTCLHLYELLF